MIQKIKNISIIVFLIIITILIIVLFFGKKQFDEDIKKANDNAYKFEKQLKAYEDKIILTPKEYEKLNEKEKVVVYKKVIEEREKIIETSKEILKENQNNIKLLEQCNAKLKKKDFIILNAILGCGLDQEFNLNAMAGGTINGKIYDGFFSKIYLGGGGVYTIRTDFKDQINGGEFIFNVIITIGK